MARKTSKDSIAVTGNYIFSDFSKGLYLIDTPRNMGEQLASLALTGGRNVWSEKGALIAQHGYLVRDKIDPNDKIIAVTRSIAGTNTFFIITYSGTVYLYTARQGLKKYKTLLPNIVAELTCSRRGQDLVSYYGGTAYLFGAYYEDSEATEIAKDISVQNFGSYLQFKAPIELSSYLWNDKDIYLKDSTSTYSFTISSVAQERGDNELTVKVIPGDVSKIPTESTVSIGEKTLYPIELIYKPENEEPSTGDGSTTPEPKPNITLMPQLMEVANNRLFIVHTDGNIYYSQIGNINSFEQKYGAGYFGGFYQDTSKTLSLEEYMDGALICKENGIYYLTIGDTVEIKKISQAGQKYASDHVIVGEKVYAFDTTSGSIVNAVSVNVFGAMVSGKPVVTSEFLNAENSGINSTKRALTYNAESEVFILYYGENLNKGIVLTSIGTFFPRELDKNANTFIGFNQGVVFISDENEIVQDFKKGSIIPNINPVANFEPIGLRDNRLICSTIAEVTELNNINYTFITSNAGISSQVIQPLSGLSQSGEFLPPLIYSDDETKYPSFELTTRWAEKASNCARIYAPMGGRNGISLSFEFPANTAFCLSAIRLADFSQGN